MKKELDEKLCAKYPLIFKNRNADMRTTAMCWGFECGDGWYNILDVLCAHLTNDYNNAKNSYEYTLGNLGKPKWDKTLTTQEEVNLAKTKMDAAEELVPTASQVKEKFGGLRFYTNGATDKHHNYISFAESMSYCICEECGAPGKRYTDGWHQTLCDIHAAMNGKSDEYESDDGEE